MIPYNSAWWYTNDTTINLLVPDAQHSPVRKAPLGSSHHCTPPGGAAGHALENGAALIFLLFVTDSSRYHCLIVSTSFLIIFPLFMPPFITCTQINLLTLAEGVECTASFHCSDQYLHRDKPTNKGWMRAWHWLPWFYLTFEGFRTFTV